MNENLQHVTKNGIIMVKWVPGDNKRQLIYSRYSLMVIWTCLVKLNVLQC